MSRFWEGALSRSSTAIKSHNFTIHFKNYRYCLQGSSRYLSVLWYFNSSGDYLPLRFLSREPVHEISNSVVCATSKASDQPTHTRSQIRAFACRLNIIWVFSYWLNIILSFWAYRGGGLRGLVWACTCRGATLLEISCQGSNITVRS